MLRGDVNILIDENGALTCISEPGCGREYRLECANAAAIFAFEDAPHNRRNSPMSLRRLGGVGGIAVRGGNVGQQVARVLFADDLELGQDNEQRFANAEGRYAIGFIETGMICQRNPFDGNPTRHGNIGALIHISEAADIRICICAGWPPASLECVSVARHYVTAAGTFSPSTLGVMAEALRCGERTQGEK